MPPIRGSGRSSRCVRSRAPARGSCRGTGRRLRPPGTARTATPPHQNTVGYWWRKTRASAGHPTVKLHDLRHFYASGLTAAGCDVVTVQRALGHSSATVTLNTYAHLWPTAEDRTRAGAAAMLAAVLGTADEPLTNEPAACPAELRERGPVRR
jgi:integrase